MNNTARYLRTTIVYGFMCAFVFYILMAGMGHPYIWPPQLYLSVSLFVAVYCIMMARWTHTGIIKIVFPLLLLFASVLLTSSLFAYLVLSLGVFSWVRSGICYKNTTISALLAEGFLIGGTCLAIFILSPHNPMSWALGIWMFFLVQTLYFVFFMEGSEVPASDVKRGAFESARYEAEKLMSEL
ncbi:MAG: hypothetical protein HKM93_04830 [Desulfobacteraceae bacterium]|nr:hypothetical protein [Desulfobacteraceae bacterium]